MIKKYIEYLKDNPKGLWFKAKLFGWGWTPATWQGWLVTLVYIVLVILSAKTVDETSSRNEWMLNFAFPVFLLTVIFLQIAYKKGEKPRWRWRWPKK